MQQIYSKLQRPELEKHRAEDIKKCLFPHPLSLCSLPLKHKPRFRTERGSSRYFNLHIIQSVVSKPKNIVLILICYTLFLSANPDLWTLFPPNLVELQISSQLCHSSASETHTTSCAEMRNRRESGNLISLSVHTLT